MQDSANIRHELVVLERREHFARLVSETRAPGAALEPAETFKDRLEACIKEAEGAQGDGASGSPEAGKVTSTGERVRLNIGAPCKHFSDLRTISALDGAELGDASTREELRKLQKKMKVNRGPIMELLKVLPPGTRKQMQVWIMPCKTTCTRAFCL